MMDPSVPQKYYIADVRALLVRSSIKYDLINQSINQLTNQPRSRTCPTMHVKYGIVQG